MSGVRTYALVLLAGVLLNGADFGFRTSWSAAAAADPSASLEDAGLVGYWKLAGDCKDSSGQGNHGVNHGVIFSNAAPDAGSGSTAGFDGLNHYIEVPDSPSLQFGTDDFSVSVWVKLEGDVTGPIGDIIGKFDQKVRKGLNFHITGSSPGYSSLSNSRHVEFGIDNAKMSPWVDCGKPWPSNPLIGTLIVHDGELYTGLSDAAKPTDACHVFRYAGGTKWIDCGRVGDDPKTPSVFSMIVHKGKLYAGTGTWDWLVAKSTNKQKLCGPNHVYRYEGGTQWVDCGGFDGYRVMSLASFKGELYATDDIGGSFHYEGGTTWKPCGKSQRGRLVPMMPFQGALYSAELELYRHDGATNWEPVSHDLLGETQTHSIGVYGGQMCLACWPVGKVLRDKGGFQWEDLGHLGVEVRTDVKNINEVMDLPVYNGKLYAAVIPKAEVYRYEGGTEWTMLKALATNPKLDRDVPRSWTRVPCLTTFQGRLFAGTGTCHGHSNEWNIENTGRVFSMEAGKNVAYDKDLRVGWSHLTVTREKGRLKLYVDGQLQAESSAFEPAEYDISNHEPLLIGFGAENYFSGGMRELRIYRRALSASEVAALHENGNRG
jgi:hypothetical protein